MTSVAPDKSQTHARLRGEALEKWYARYSDMTPEQWEAEQERIEREQRKTARFILMLASPAILCFTYPILPSILGIWLVIGRGNSWIRVLITLAFTFLLGMGDPLLTGFWLLELFVAISLTYLLALLIPKFYLMPSRSIQFTLWQIGGVMLLIGGEMALLRALGFNIKSVTTNIDFEHFLFVGCVTPVVIVVACSMVLIPSRYRSGRLFLFAAGFVFFLAPILEFPFMILLGGDIFGMLLMLHFAGVPCAWVLTLFMECAGAFCDVTPPSLIKEPEGDPLATR